MPDGSATTSATEPGTLPTTPTTTITAPATIPHPTGADDVIVKVSYEGGLVAPGYLFTAVPTLLISGDGRVFQPAPIPAVFPGPLLPSVSVRTITEAGIQAVLAILDHAGLLAPPPEYPDRHNVADGSTTVLTIQAAGGTFEHSAYALGMGGEPETGARQNLLDAVTRLSDIEASAGTANLGSSEPFVAVAYRLQARVVAPIEVANQDPPPTTVDWPLGGPVGIALRDVGDCARVDAAAVGTLFIDAKQNTYFREDDDVLYQLAVRGVLPGDPAC